MKSEEEYRKTIQTISEKLGNTHLMAVSKTRSVEEIDAVYRCGVRLFGENHVQEIVQKFSDYRPQGMELHMIGHLQTNKVSKVVPLVDMIESVDSIRLLQKINAEAAKNSKTMDVLLEYNTSGEESKSGFGSKEDLFDCIEAAFDMDNIHLRGLMTVGPLEHPENTRDAFRFLKNLFDECRIRYGGKLGRFDTLSMGMSGDWELAVKEGSTQVRIGTTIFGERHYD